MIRSGQTIWMIAVLLLDTASAVQIDVSRKVSGNATSVNSTTTTTAAVLTTTATPATTTTTQTSIVQANSTASNGTVAILANATAQSPADATWPSGQQQNRQPHHGRTRSAGLLCACDLTINLCDINCCCDVDCDDRALGAFVCTTAADDYDQSLGGLHSCEVQNDWLCVIAGRATAGDTSEGTYDSGRRSLIKHRWSPVYPETTATANEADHRSAYRFGDTVNAFFADSPPTRAQPFRVSAPLAIAEHCTLQLPLRFMAETTVQCRRSSASHARYIVDMRRKLVGAMLPRSRQVDVCNNTVVSIVNTTGNATANVTANATTQATPNCVPVLLFECLHHIEEASCRLQRNESAPDDESSDRTEGLENNLIRIDIVHDFEHILNASVYLVYGDGSQSSDVRHTVVHFVQLNETRTPHHEVSGPDGYTAGLAVIVSHMRPANMTAPSSDLVLDYFHANGSSNRTHVMRIPRIDADGRCVLNNMTLPQEPIVIGQDFRVKCDIPLRGDADAEISAAGTNFTELCARMQLTIFEHLLADVRHGYAANRSSDAVSTPTLISMLGNPVNRTERWTRLRWTDGFDDDGLADMLPAISGEVLLDEDADADASVIGFRCAQMVLSVRYEFAIVWTGIGGWQVHEASVSLGTRLDVRFGSDELDEWRVPVFVEGQFLDLTAAASTVRRSCIIWIVFVAFVVNINNN